MRDMSCLADGYVVSADPAETKINANEIIVGGTGSGKSFSNAYSRLLHTYDSSVIISASKKEIRDKFEGLFESRGYEVVVMDFTKPQSCTYGYDPMDYIKSDEDVVRLAKAFVTTGRGSMTASDPYWDEAATSLLAAEIGLIRLNAIYAGRRAHFADVIKLHRIIAAEGRNSGKGMNVDWLFKAAKKYFPGNQATEMWNTYHHNSDKTAACVMSVLNTAIDKIFSENVLEMMNRTSLSFEELGKRKIALFIISSPINKTLAHLVNVMFSDIFNTLFESAEQGKSGRLNVPVHVIFDDFACTSRIADFDSYISIFRAAGISVTLLLQSESQLKAMYGDAGARTIINNCDTYVYMGGNDEMTGRSISTRMDMPIKKALSMPLEQVIVFRRGSEPVMRRRYQTLDDPVYEELEAIC